MYENTNYRTQHKTKQRNVMQQSTPIEEAIPSEGVVAGFVASDTVTVPGPALAIPVVHDPAGVSHSAERRIQPTGRMLALASWSTW